MLAIAGACLAWGIDNNLTRKLSSADPVQIAMLKGLAAGTVNLALALTLGAPLPTTRSPASENGVGFGVGLTSTKILLSLYINIICELKNPSRSATDHSTRVHRRPLVSTFSS